MQVISEFKRGGTFSATVKIPDIEPDGKFFHWFINARIRKHKDPSDCGSIATLYPAWIDPATTREISVVNIHTEDWPLGIAEWDILLTSPEGVKYLTPTNLVNIVSSVSY